MKEEPTDAQDNYSPRDMDPSTGLKEEPSDQLCISGFVLQIKKEEPLDFPDPSRDISAGLKEEPADDQNICPPRDSMPIVKKEEDEDEDIADPPEDIPAGLKEEPADHQDVVLRPVLQSELNIPRISLGDLAALNPTSAVLQSGPTKLDINTEEGSLPEPEPAAFTSRASDKVGADDLRSLYKRSLQLDIQKKKLESVKAKLEVDYAKLVLKKKKLDMEKLEHEKKISPQTFCPKRSVVMPTHPTISDNDEDEGDDVSDTEIPDHSQDFPGQSDMGPPAKRKCVPRAAEVLQDGDGDNYGKDIEDNDGDDEQPAPQAETPSKPSSQADHQEQS